MTMEAYRSLYGDLTKLKDGSLLDDPAAGSGADAALFNLLLAASEAVDRHCNRHFYALAATRRFDGPGEASLALPDAIEVASVHSDDDGDGERETEWPRGAYELLPLNAEPRAHWGGPHYALRARGGRRFERGEGRLNAEPRAHWGGPHYALRARGGRRFERGEGRYEARGWWGYGERLEASGSTLRTRALAASATLDVTRGADFAVGQTLALNDERALVRGISSNRLTVTRGLNGTAPADHRTGTAASIVRWPAPVERAALINAARLWTRAPAFEPFYVDADLDTDVRLLLEPYRAGGGR